MKKIYALFLCLLLTVTAWAIPAMKGLRTVQQPDGTTLQIQLIGDEFFSYTATADGVPVMKTLTGAYVYANIREGITLPTATMAHDAALRQPAEAQLVNELKQQKVTPSERSLRIRQENNEQTIQRAQARRERGVQNAIEGQKHCLIILVDYVDKKMTHSQAEFQDMASTTNYSKNNHVGSLSDFFYDQSYGKLSVNFDVVGPFTLEHEMAYYGRHTKEDNDSLPGAMISEAVHLAHAAGVNYAKYDWTGNGSVDQVFVIYAGYAEAQGGAPETIWPHKWSLTSAAYFQSGGTGRIKYDGVWIDTYACSSELRNASGNQICGIGTAAHEFSHCLGLPDLYDTDYSGGTGMSTWSLMDGGGYRANGDIPTPYTAQERSYIGWMDLIELNKPQKVVNLPSIIDEPVAYIVRNAGFANEYYILENHQQTNTSKDYRNWDKSAPGHGMLVTHVDFNANIWANNRPNDDPKHQRCIFIGADGRTSAGSGSLYPGRNNKTALTNTTSPAATTYNANTDGKKFMNAPIESITEHGGLIDFSFDGGVNISIPEAQPATNVTSTSFTANWSSVEEADSYTLEVIERGEESLLFIEDFSVNERFNVTKESTADISAKLDNFLVNEGWTGKNLFIAPKKLKLGLTSASGSLVSPVYKTPSDGMLKLELGVQPVQLSPASVVVTILNEKGAELGKETIKPDNSRHTLEFSNINSNFSIKIATDKNRAFVDYIAAYAAFEQPDTAWTSLGKGFASDFFLFEETDIPCEYFQHKEDKQLFRVENPFVVMLKAYGESTSSDASDYIYVRLLKKGETMLDKTIDRDNLVFYYGDYAECMINIGYTNSSYGADICMSFPGFFSGHDEVSDWKDNKVLSYQESGLPKRVHFAPIYYMFDIGGWDTTTETVPVFYLDFPDAKNASPVMKQSINKGVLRYRALTDENLQVALNPVSSSIYATHRRRVPGQKTIIAEITGTSYDLTELTENAVYIYRVKAVNAEGESKWSEKVNVDLSQGTGIISVPSAAHQSPAEEALYDLSGRRVERMQRGIYIQGGKAVIVK